MGRTLAEESDDVDRVPDATWMPAPGSADFTSSSGVGAFTRTSRTPRSGELLGCLRCLRIGLLDDEVALVPLDGALELGHLVTGHDGEAASVAA